MFCFFIIIFNSSFSFIDAKRNYFKRTNGSCFSPEKIRQIGNCGRDTSHIVHCLHVLGSGCVHTHTQYD